MTPPSRRTLLLSCGATALVVLAGCSTDDSGGTGSPGTTTDTPPETGTTTDTATTVPPSEVTAFDDLSETAQSVFEDAYFRGPVERASDRVPAVLLNGAYVRYQGDVYAVVSEGAGGLVAEYSLSAALVDESAVEDGRLVGYADLSPAAQAAFETAVSESQFTVRGEPLPGRLDEIGYVRYEERYYELTVVVADIPTVEVSVEELGE